MLSRLTASYRLVAVVSGRPGRFLAEHLAVTDLVRWGSYGLERVEADGSVVAAAEAEAWKPAVAAVVRRARETAPPGVGIEDKGVSVTLHVRTAPGQEGWVRSFASAEAEATGLVVHDAKMSVELRPPLDVDKGVVVGRLLDDAGVSAACFIGDDHGDLSAFAALAAVHRGVRVAVRSAESPAALLEQADLIVDGPEGVLALLRSLVP